MFWIIVLHVAVAGTEITAAGPAVAFVDPKECASAVEILKAEGHDSAECRTVKILSDKAEEF